jgi:hypothetical protein
MAKTKNYSNPQFIVRQAKDGKSWSVFCELGYRRPIEIPDFYLRQPLNIGSMPFLRNGSKNLRRDQQYLTASEQEGYYPVCSL